MTKPEKTIEQIFIKNIERNPASDERLIYADLLEDQGQQPMAQHLRISHRLENELEKLSPEEMWDLCKTLVSIYRQQDPLTHNYPCFDLSYLNPYGFMRKRCYQNETFFKATKALFVERLLTLANKLFAYAQNTAPPDLRVPLSEIADRIHHIAADVNYRPVLPPDQLRRFRKGMPIPYFFAKWIELQPEIRTLMEGREKFNLPAEISNLVEYFSFNTPSSPLDAND